MIALIYFLLFTLINTQKCSFKTPIKYEQVYLCQEKLNSTSLRIWLHFKFDKNKEYMFLYYSFTLRTIDLIEEHRMNLKDRFEKRIGDYMEINSQKKENNTINIHHLASGRYEICVNFLKTKQNNQSYYRSSNSCLYIPWNVPESEEDHPNLFIHVLFMFMIIILLVTIAFFIYAVHQYFKSRKPLPVSTVIDEELQDNDHSERVRFLVNQHFTKDVKPLESLVRKRIHRRYAHRSPDLNDTRD